jgi:hypothetical protein
MLEERPALGMDVGPAELGGAGALDAAPEVARHQLHPVADAERRDSELPEAGIDLGRVVGVDRRRAAAEDERSWVACPDRLRRRLMRDQLRVHPALPHPPRDQLRVLPTEVDHEDGSALWCLLRHRKRDDFTHARRLAPPYDEE